LKEEVGTLPRFFYYFDERYPRSLDPEAEAIARSLGHEASPMGVPTIPGVLPEGGAGVEGAR
jgi:hypothetical protein